MRLKGALTIPKITVQKALRWLTSPRAALMCGGVFFRPNGIPSTDGRGLLQAERVLVVRLDEIGDVVMTTPFLRELRRNLPEAWITLVVKPQVHELVDICPYVNEVLTYNWEVNGRHEALRRHWRAVRLAWCQLRQRRFDLAILPRWDADSYHGTFLLYFSGAARRIGYSEQVNAHKRRANQGFDLLLTHPLKEGDLKHEVQHNLDVIRYLGGQVLDDKLELWLSREDEAFAEQFLGEKRVEPDEMLVGLAPGAGAPKRIWPVDRFGELGLWLQQRYGARLLVVGGPGEEPLGKELERKIGSNVVNAVGRTTLRQTGALLKRCRIFVGNDAGPMHVAAAVGIPVVEVSCHPKSGSPWNANSPLRFGPWRVSHKVLQPQLARHPCLRECIAQHAHCILNVTVEEVKSAITEQLSEAQCRAGML